MSVQEWPEIRPALDQDRRTRKEKISKTGRNGQRQCVSDRKSVV